MSKKPSMQDEPESLERREALKAIRKYTTLGIGASVVVLSSADAVKAQSYNGCQNGNSPNCN